MSHAHRYAGALLAAAFALTVGAGVATAEILPDGAIGAFGNNGAPGNPGSNGNVGIGGANVGPIGVEGITAGPGGASVGGYDVGVPGSFPGFG